MKKLNLNILLLLIGNTLFAQVGINTALPNATLDVMVTPSSTAPQGIIAPRLTGDEIKALNSQYTTDQTGVIVYATSAVTQPNNDPKTSVITSPCYYYFDGVKWNNLGLCTDAVYGAEIIKTIYTGTAPDPTKTVSIGNYSFRFGNVSGSWRPQIRLISAPSATKTVYIGFNQQYQTNGFEYRNYTRDFTPANFSTYVDIPNDGTADFVNSELNIVHIVDVEANTYYRVTYYISGPDPGTKAFIIAAEKF